MIPGDLSGRLRFLLDTAAGAIVDAPARRLVGLSPVPVDCDMVAVGFVRAYRGTVGVEDRTPRQFSPGRVIEADVVVLRCHPTLDSRGNAPSPAAIQVAALGAVADGFLVADALEGAGWPNGHFQLGATSALAPGGGFGGISVRVQFRAIGT